MSIKIVTVIKVLHRKSTYTCLCVYIHKKERLKIQYFPSGIINLHLLTYTYTHRGADRTD